ncbi:MAG TPA: PQQ-dependent sugar dehydrogenase [Kiloniellales bacterium]|nr:PQQ-dependent sugar dehydrogenase [Kiloniellales bacterium]
MTRGLEHPWSMAFLPDGRILVTERPGRLRLIDSQGNLLPEPLAGVPEVVAGGQGGLLDIALHPGFEQNGLVYLTYSGRQKDRVTTKLARGQFAEDRLVDTEVLFAARTEGSGGRHFGSRIAFDPRGYLWMTVGERGQAKEAQNLSNHNGTTLRLNDDGSAPDDNPFVGNEGKQPEIWSYGHRNAQGLAVEPGSGTIWLHEHGPRGGDEINIPRRGLNYGWPITTHGTAYSGLPVGIGPQAPGFEPPLLHWTPSIGPSGLAFHGGDHFPSWQGDLFVGGLARPQLRRVMIEESTIVGEEELLAELGLRIRDVRLGPNGYLYLLTDESDGALLRLEPLVN